MSSRGPSSTTASAPDVASLIEQGVALRRAGDHQAAELIYASCEAQLGELDQARHQFEALLRLEPGNFSAWLELGHVFRRQGSDDAMVRAYRRAMDAAPHRWEALFAMARGLEDAGQFELAAVAYHQAVLAGGAAAAQQPEAVSYTHLTLPTKA